MCTVTVASESRGQGKIKSRDGACPQKRATKVSIRRQNKGEREVQFVEGRNTKKVDEYDFHKKRTCVLE